MNAKWEAVGEGTVYRMKIDGGWLYKNTTTRRECVGYPPYTTETIISEQLVFVPDIA